MRENAPGPHLTLHSDRPSSNSLRPLEPGRKPPLKSLFFSFLAPGRQALLPGLANELEQLLDAAISFEPTGWTRRREFRAQLSVQLARSMDYQQLADELEHAADATANATPPPLRRNDRRLAYRVGLRWLPECYRMRKQLRRLTRRSRH